MIFHQLLLFMQQSLVHLRYYLLSKLSILTATHCRSHVLPILRQLVLLLPSSIEILILLLKKIVIFSLRLVVIVNHWAWLLLVRILLIVLLIIQSIRLIVGSLTQIHITVHTQVWIVARNVVRLIPHYKRSSVLLGRITSSLITWKHSSIVVGSCTFICWQIVWTDWSLNIHWLLFFCYGSILGTIIPV